MAVGAGNGTVRADKGKLSLAVIEPGKVFPILGGVTSFAAGGRAVGAESLHALGKLVPVRILVAGNTGKFLEMINRRCLGRRRAFGGCGLHDGGSGQQRRWVDELGYKLNTPRAPAQRGGSIVFDFESSADVCRELNRRKFFCDHRPGVGLRIAPHFYTKAEEIDLFFGELKKIRGGTGR